jgi:2-polyprenyl-3-methyl-5-hydroxy-6-metoxy-1,4-benzoquinol methylase
MLRNKEEIVDNNMADANLQELYQSIDNIELDFRNANLYKLLLSYCHKHTLLDVGSGVGHFLALAQNGGFLVTGVEPNQKLTSLGEGTYKNLNVFNTAAENYITQDTYDNITFIDVLEHIKNDKDALTQYVEHLDNSGRLIIVVPAHPLLYGRRDRLIGHYRRYSKKQLSALVSECGLRLINIRHWNAVGYLPYLFAEKILGKALETTIRARHNQKGVRKMLSKALFAWLGKVENKVDFHFGLSLICVATKE